MVLKQSQGPLYFIGPVVCLYPSHPPCNIHLEARLHHIQRIHNGSTHNSSNTTNDQLLNKRDLSHHSPPPSSHLLDLLLRHSLLRNETTLITKFVVIPDPLYNGVFMIFPCWLFGLILLHFWLVVPVCLHTTITSYPPLFGILGCS